MQTVISLVSSGMGFALVPPSVRNLKRRGIQYRRLRGAAAQFNRYNQRKISVTDEVGDMRIGGSFQLKNVDAFCRLLERAYGLQVEYQPEQIKISAR